MIDSKKVINGGASDAEVERLWRKGNGLPERKGSGRSCRQPSLSRSQSHRPKLESRHNSHMSQSQGAYVPLPEMLKRHGSQLSRISSNGRNGRPIMGGRTQSEVHTARDGYGAPPQQRIPASRTGYAPLSPQISNGSRRFQGL
jgi:hypothetical protein